MARNSGPVFCRACGQEFESRKLLFAHQRATCSGAPPMDPLPKNTEGVFIPVEHLPDMINVIRTGGFVAVKVYGHFYPGQGLKIESTELIG